ncbi:MAG: helix-turn-helix transcriptional regulator [Clostridia bacterium]|nr:helix-turn-helix transcriptional regulator [Clostridia bacterium]
MNIGELISIKTVSDDLPQTRYNTELKIFTCVQLGDLERLMAEIDKVNATIVAGNISENPVTQFRYLAVSAITLATRYAIQGGLNEKAAYDFSDKLIAKVDQMNSADDILTALAYDIVALTKMVGENRSKPKQSPHIKKCISYINEHLEDRLSVKSLAEICGISPDYLSQIFKREMGDNLSSYILTRKLEHSKELIAKGRNNKEICETLKFSSPSYFVTVFKKKYHMTPSEYKLMLK